jgi:hypothetical protein
MSNATVHQSYVDEFRDHVRHLSQQKYSRLRHTVDNDSFQSETGRWDRLSSGDSAAKTRKMATPETGRVWSTRIAIATPYNDAEVTEVEDPSKMITDPNSQIVQSLGMSMGRRFDDLIIAAATGNAVSTDRTIATGDTNPPNIAFPAGQEVGDYTGYINFDVITAIQEKFLENDIDVLVPKYAVVGPKQVRKMMQLTEQTSSDYVRSSLDELSATGITQNWMGFTWIMSTRLLAPLANQLDCLFYTDQAMGLHTPQDMVTFVERDPSLSYAWRPYCQIDSGAVRIEDEHIVRFKANDTAL